MMKTIVKTIGTLFGTAKYPAFMVTNFSSKMMLVFLALHCVFESSVFGVFDQHLAATNIPFMLSFRVLRASITILMGLVWLLKTEEGVQPPSSGVKGALAPHVLTFQASSVLLMTLAVSTQTLCEVFVVDPQRAGLSAQALLSISGLKQVAPLAFFVMRDTPLEAIVSSWIICLATSIICCVKAQDKEQFVTLLLYAMASYVIFTDNIKQNQKMVEIVTKLQNTLKENEQLAVEAQAIELRAMIGNVAHDLKTPLTSFLSGIECLSDILDEWSLFLQTSAFRDRTFVWTQEHTNQAMENHSLMRNCIANMNSTNSFMTMTINRCLDYTKSTNGFKLVPKFETVSLKSALEMPAKLITDANADVQIRVLPLSEEISSHIITDKQWLLENLLCLLSNAAKYSHKGHIDVTVALTEAADLPALRFEVQDTGIGLSDEAMQGLFNPFKQAQRLAGGTGLGLFSLAKRMEALHGQYGVMRRPDGEQGSVFWFTIPYRPDKMSADSSPSVHTDDSENGIASQAMSNLLYDVLVVDDAPLIVKMTTMLLQRKNHRVHHAVNGVEALEKLNVRAGSGETSYDLSRAASMDAPVFSSLTASLFDVVLMDLQMPVLDGLEAIRRLRASEQRNEAENGVSQRQFVIALSANSDEETREEAFTAGADAFIPKPFSYDAFSDAMKDFKAFHERHEQL